MCMCSIPTVYRASVSSVTVTWARREVMVKRDANADLPLLDLAATAMARAKLPFPPSCPMSKP